MVSGHDLADTDSARLEAVSRVAHQSLLFGEFSAKAAGHDTFEDPVMHTYFLRPWPAMPGWASRSTRMTS